jgi:5-methylcytosine-specific restriction endonuclease McrA
MITDSTTKITSKVCTGCLEEKPLEDYYKKTKGRLGRCSRCKICLSLKDKEYLETNKEKIAERRKARYKADPESIKKSQAAYRNKSENREAARARSKKWRQENPKRVKELNKYWSKKHYSENKSYHIAKDAERRARKIGATPSWLTEKQKTRIANIYDVCKKVSETTGKPHHVDHVVPLKGEDICGLHVPWNLAIIPAKMNLSKGNRMLEARDVKDPKRKRDWE